MSTLDVGSVRPTDKAPRGPVLLVGNPSQFEASGVTRWLESHSWPATLAADYDKATWLARVQRVSLVMVGDDGASPGLQIGALRSATAAPLVVLAAPSGETVVELVSAGVDAVIDPERGPDEVFARVSALLRRLDQAWDPAVRYLVSQDLTVDLWSQDCRSAGSPLHLSPTEFALLSFLMSRPNQALPAQTIVRKVWGWPPTDGRNALRIFVNRLRRKLDDDHQHPRYIESVRGTGYRFVGNVTELGETAPEPGVSGATLAAAPFVESIEALALGLAQAETPLAAIAYLASCLDATGFCDALAVFKIVGTRMQLLDQRHCPSDWLERVRQGVPLDHTFASAHSVLTGETVCFGDVAVAGQCFSSTAKHFSAGDFHAALFLPIVLRGRVWGNVGISRRTRQPFDVTGVTYLRAVVAILTLALDRFETSGGDTAARV